MLQGPAIYLDNIVVREPRRQPLFVQHVFVKDSVGKEFMFATLGYWSLSGSYPYILGEV